MILRIGTHLDAWGVFQGQEATPIYVGSICDCIDFRARR